MFGNPNYVATKKPRRMDIVKSNNVNNSQTNSSSNFDYNNQGNNDENNGSYYGNNGQTNSTSNFDYNNQGNNDVNNSQTNSSSNFDYNNQGNNGQFNDSYDGNNRNNNDDNNGQGNNGQNNYVQGSFLRDSNDDDTTNNNIATFKRFYTPYNGYNATDTCNPVTARLIIFYNDKLFPFLKKYYVQSSQRPEIPTNILVIQVFIFFFQLIFYQNFYKYNDNEQTWLANQVNMIENNIIKNSNSLNLFKQGTKFVDVLDFIKKHEENKKGPTNNYIYKTVDELLKVPSLSDPLKKLFLNFMEVINKYYNGYYSQYFYDFYYYFDGIDKKKIIDNTENISTISVNMKKYLKPFIDNATNRELIDDITVKEVQDSDLEKILKKEYPEVEIFIHERHAFDKNREVEPPNYTYYFENRNTWDEIFEKNDNYTNIDLDTETENANASGVVASQPSSQPSSQPAPVPPQPTNDTFKVGDIAYAKTSNGNNWIPVKVTGFSENLIKIAYNYENTHYEAYVTFDQLSKTDLSSQPASAQPVQPTNDTFKTGDIVYAQIYAGGWVQVRITDVHDTEGTADFQLVADTNLKATNVPFDRLSRTDPTKTMGGKLTFSNRVKNGRKSLKNLKKKSFKRKNRSLKKIV
jgi:exosome complex RNA-binding protein Csl4